MRTDNRTNKPPKAAIRGNVLEVEIVNDESTGGNLQKITDQEVQHESEPLVQTFGLLSSKVYNERNSNKSRRTDVNIDVNDLHELVTWDYNGVAELGDDVSLTYTSLVDITDVDTTELNSGHLFLKDTIEEFDRVHGRRETVRVQSWEPRVTVQKGHPDAGGNDLRVTTQVVQETTPWPTTTSNTLGIQREEIGVDKFRQTHSEAPDCFGQLISHDNFGFRGCKTRTTQQKVDNDFVLPARGALEIASTIEQLDGFKSNFTKVEVVDGWPTFTSYEEEPVTGKRVTVVRTIHSTEPASAANATPRVVTSINHTECDRWTKVVRTIDPTILTTNYTEYHTVEYDFPKYLDEDEPFRTYNGSSETSYENPKISSAYRLKVQCRFVFSYHTTQPAPPEIFQFKTVDINLFGFLFLGGDPSAQRINIPNVLTDGFTASMALPISGGAAYFTENFVVPASSPTTSEYKEYMEDGDEALIIWDVTKWKYNLCRQVKVFMTFPDLEGAAGGVTS